MANIYNEILRYGYLIRGAIVEGEFFYNDIIVYGKGLIEAVNLEEKEANVPRILVRVKVTESNSYYYLMKDNDNELFLNTFHLCDSFDDVAFKINLLEMLKAKVLDLAIKGKLVPQNSEDESADILLEKIREEKEKLIKEGKLKHDKNETFIFKNSDDNSYYEQIDGETICIDNDLPFEIPDSWRWCKLRTIGQYKKGPFGSALTKSIFVPKYENAIKVYEQKNAIQKDVSLGSYYITNEYYESKMKSFTVFPGEIIVSCAGTIGETYILPSNIEKGIINQALMRISLTENMNINYFLNYFDFILKREAIENSQGTAIKNIPPFDVLKEMYIAIPPINEQNRIVEKIENIFTYLDNLETIIKGS